ncbi:MAG: DUF3500 domain-containing protein [Gammaproteobacteria bacterium]|nr:DUF3500 domain-containing protein [Gammaproteobacteria bacterium]
MRCALLLIAVLAAAPGVAAAAARPGAERCVAAAQVFLDGLVPAQRQRVVRPWSDAARGKPMFPPGITPAPTGMRIGELADGQRVRLHDFLGCALSSQGYQKVAGIIRRGDMVADTYKDLPAPQRETRAKTGALHFWITLFGDPSADKPFGWRLEGHHLLLQFSVERGLLVPGPTWLAVDPAVMTKGTWAGFRILDAEFTRGLELLEGLGEAHRRQAIVADRVPQEMATTPGSRAQRGAAAGLPVGTMSLPEREIFWRLVDEYLGNLEAGTAARLRRQIESEGGLHFAWRGPAERGQPVYYRVQGPSLDLEFSHALDVRGPQRGFDLNHIHTWWHIRPAP